MVLWGRETIYRDGQRVGWLSSGGFGHTVGRAIGMGYVRHPDGVSEDFVLSGRYELEVASERVPAEVHLEPLYDPKGLRVKAEPARGPWRAEPGVSHPRTPWDICPRMKGHGLRRVPCPVQPCARRAEGKMRHGGRILADHLAAYGVERVFSVPGESFLAALDGLHDLGIANIVCRHEGGAAMMAEATGKLTGRPGVAFVTRGRGRRMPPPGCMWRGRIRRR